ncbi:MAG: 4a-hydroxytetrahydrobiopterin dehydratase [Rhizobiales bacterium]|nr:4a-hydroxytetrahydrobiopterin dehydratase [Hyphomicrobiales bacterium]
MSANLSAKTCTPCRGGVDPLSLAAAREYLESTPRWSLMDDGRRLERKFTFKDFAQALDFVNRVGAIAEEEGHHPDISFGWGYATVSVFTHKIKGLHENDFILASKIDRLPGAQS